MPVLGSSNEVEVKFKTSSDTKAAKEVQGEIEKTEKKVKDLQEQTKSSAKLVAGGLFAMGAAAIGAGASAVTMGAQFEQSQIAFTTLLGDAQKSSDFLKELFDFAAKTPFEFNGLQSAARSLLAFGFEAENILPMMTSIGDAVGALGGGAFEIDRITRALGQMQAKGKVSAEEMMQLAELGIPVWDMLAEKLGVTVPEAMDLASKGIIKGSEGVNAVLEGMSKRFGGSMEAQSQTTLGLWSTLVDTATQGATKIGLKLIDAFDIKGLLDNIIASVDTFSDSLINMVDFLSENQGLLLIWAGTLSGIFFQSLIVASGGFTALAASIWATVTPMIALAAPFLAIGALLTLIYLAWTNNFMGIQEHTQNFLNWFNENIMPGLQYGFDVIGQVLTTAGQIFSNVFNLIIKPALGLFLTYFKSGFMAPLQLAFKMMGLDLNSLGINWSNTWDGIKNVVSTALSFVVSTVKNKINNVIGLINKMISGANSVGGKIPGYTNIDLIPQLANGTDFFKGGVALVGERGPELVNLPRGSSVTPNNRLGSVGTTIYQENNIYNQVDLDLATRDLAFQVATL